MLGLLKLDFVYHCLCTGGGQQVSDKLNNVELIIRLDVFMRKQVSR